ncbi:MAG: hypothetical protein JNL61_05505 [Rhizobiaceae bacterium]|nr:hypothetical protein [Rhizobiaceae bacterium]
MYRFLLAALKIAVASVLTGAALSALDLSASDILAEMGMTPEKMAALIDRGIAWTLPNLILGSLVIVPIWLVVSLFRPPRS